MVKGLVLNWLNFIILLRLVLPIFGFHAKMSVKSDHLTAMNGMIARSNDCHAGATLRIHCVYNK